ncbi:hypothetical protein [Mucilaginibacter sp. UR6-11]|uniref:hypothetical protein n=1 Tax=Mucilaginibacter sp. UR6-11 TaxID=1435644 RepID=UPI001E5D7FF3|nr:hypothetical protein [Mucilaginibacter sp. UR6-11]MCC8426713.1 hypothetical protein [Mucilaginibacter sp. UR6-11]
MLKITCACLFLCCLSIHAVGARPPVKRDSLLTILHISNPQARERQLILFLRYYFEDVPKNRLDATKAETNLLMQRYDVTDRIGIGYFIETLSLMQLRRYREAERALIQAIALADKNDDSYLLYACFTHLGFIQTYYGNMIEATSSFRMAKKQAGLLEDAYMQVIIDINISDIYYRINLYSQALFYIDQARSLMISHHITEPKIKNAINNNKAEIYFHMGNIDSLKKYNQVLTATRVGTYRLYSYQKRTNYYVDLLQHNYSGAISRLQQLRKDSAYRFDNTDEQNLADAYFMAGMPDSARVAINRLLAGEAQNNHPEIKSHLYDMLGLIAEKDRNPQQAVFGFKMALQQAKEQIGRLTSVDTISAQIKMDEMQSAYIQKTENYKRERLWLIFAVIITVLSLIIVALFYRNIKRKKYYEQLFFTAKKEELAFINSHEVRRHLSNILGIIDTIKQSDDKHQAYIEAEDHLLCAAANMDTAIKNISDKLEA